MQYLYLDIFWLVIKYVAPVAIVVSAMCAAAYWVPLGHAEPPPEPGGWEPQPPPPLLDEVTGYYHDDGRREF